MITINVAANTAELLANIELQKGRAARAQARAINRTVEQLRTEAGREVRAEYAVTLRGIRQASTIKRAFVGSKFPFGELTFSGRPINLMEFGARAVNPFNVKGRRHRRDGGGVSVQVKVKAGRKLIKRAFITTLKSGQNAGKQGVFRRVGAGRYPIRFLPSLSIPQMVAARAINQALLKFSNEKYLVNFRHELEFVLTGT